VELKIRRKSKEKKKIKVEINPLALLKIMEMERRVLICLFCDKIERKNIFYKKAC